MFQLPVTSDGEMEQVELVHAKPGVINQSKLQWEVAGDTDYVAPSIRSFFAIQGYLTHMLSMNLI